MEAVIIFAICFTYVLCQTGTNAPVTPVVGARCKNDTDCPTNECCVHSPLAPYQMKRLLFDIFQHDHGYCRMKRKENQTCMPIGHDIYNPDLHEFHCPCVAGLECRGMTVHESEHQIVHENPICQQLES